MANQKSTTVLFLPGLLCDARLFEQQKKALEKQGHQCLIPNLHQFNTIPDMARYALSRVDGPVGVVGLSKGGYVAMEIARMAPERLSHLSLINTSARADSDDKKKQRQRLIQQVGYGKFLGITPRLLPELINHNHLKNPDVTQPIIDMAQRIGKQGFINQQTAIMARPDSRDTLANLQDIPSLVIAGADDKITPVDRHQEMNDLLPMAKLHILENCGHLAPLERPEKVNRLLSKLFKI